MFIRLWHGVAIAACLGMGACGPCPGLWQRAHYSNPGLSQTTLSNGAGTMVGEFLGGTDFGPLSFKLLSPTIKEPPDMVRFTLEVYPTQSVCPPDPGSKLLSLGIGMPTYQNSTDVTYDFSLEGSGHKVMELADKVLVLRADNAAAEPTVGTVCTPAVVFEEKHLNFCATD